VIAKVIMRLTYPHADQVIAVSEGIRADLMENFGVDEAKIRVIYNPLDTDRVCERALETPSTRVPEPYIVGTSKRAVDQVAPAAISKISAPRSTIIRARAFTAAWFVWHCQPKAATDG
jgi:glycosyltransferase involved in cell wall biosynthesis